MADRNVDEELTCHVCDSVFLHPITNTCGHTTCQSCLRICRRRCPECRAAIIPGIGVNIALQALIERKFPEALAARIQEAAAEAKQEAERGRHQLFLETGELLADFEGLNGILVARFEEMVFQEFVDMNLGQINGIQILECSQLRVLCRGRELAAEAPLPGPEHHLILRITEDNQERIQGMAKRFAEDAAEEEVTVMTRITVDLETLARSPQQSRKLSRLLDEVESYVEKAPPAPSSRGSYNLSILENLAKLIETHTEDLENLPQLIKDLAVAQGF